MSMDTDRLEADVQESRHRLNDTITELGSKLSPGQMLDEGIGLLQGQAGRFAGQLGRQVRDNPLPVVLIGAGIAWLVVSSRKSSSAALERQSEDEYHQRRYRTIEEARWANPRLPSETDEAYEERVHQAYSSALGLKQLAGEAANEFKDRVKRTVEGIQYAATRAGGRISRTLKGTGRRLGDTLASTKDRVGGAYSDSRDKLGSFASSGKERLVALASDARTMAGEQAQHLRETAEEARARAERFYDDAPIAAGAIALAIGALVGALTPLSSPERRTLRGVAEGAVNRGAGLAERGIRAVGDRLDGALH
jgi:ElaB/YqjD/DUF883 family membrane-anchored ribosome-binding protein